MYASFTVDSENKYWFVPGSISRVEPFISILIEFNVKSTLLADCNVLIPTNITDEVA